MRMTLEEWVSSDLNKERLNIKMDVPDVGYGEVYEYIDFAEQILSLYVKDTDSCYKVKLPFQVDLK